MNQERELLYKQLHERVGNTPLVGYAGHVANGNNIFIKEECNNPFGSHYDRVYLALFEQLERAGRLNPGSKVIETSSGSAGVSFAGIGKLLGYECIAAMPAGGEKAREHAIREHLLSDAHLILTPAQEYVNAFPRFISRFLVKNKDVTYLNHSMGPNRSNNEATLTALETIATEIVAALAVDVFIPAIGNGSTVLGPARKLDARTKVIGFETMQSAVAYEHLHPGRYESEFAIKPGSLSRHTMPGTSYNGISFPHLTNALAEKKIDDVFLVTDKKLTAEYESKTGRSVPPHVIAWDETVDAQMAPYGRTTRAGFAVAQAYARSAAGKNMVIIAYDKRERYDS